MVARQVGIVIHGGAGAWKKKRKRACEAGCRKAARVGLRVLRKGGAALEAVVAAAQILENDPRFNAGIGSVPRMDGKTIEMDAALMVSDGRIGAVAATSWPRNPIAVARAVMDTPHIMLAGEGADRFAKKLGFAQHPGMPAKGAAAINALRRRALDATGLPRRWRGQPIEKIWNFKSRLAKIYPNWQAWSCDTIGACAVDGEGRLAVANSTGGASPMLLGRVGDSPLPGAGYWAGPDGAVCATGVGEEIARVLLCRTVHDWIAAGMDPQDACYAGVALVDAEFASAGLIALTPAGWGAAANGKNSMPTAFMTL